MSGWTMKEMEDTDNLLFAICILNERANKLNPYAPLYAKIKAAVREIETIRNHQMAEANERKRLENDVYGSLYALVIAKFPKMKVLHDHLHNEPFVRAIDIYDLDMKVAFTETIKFNDGMYCAVYLSGAKKPSCYIMGDALDDFIYVIYEDIGDGIFGVKGQYDSVVFGYETNAYKKLEEMKAEV